MIFIETFIGTVCTILSLPLSLPISLYQVIMFDKTPAIADELHRVNGFSVDELIQSHQLSLGKLSFEEVCIKVLESSCYDFLKKIYKIDEADQIVLTQSECIVELRRIALTVAKEHTDNILSTLRDNSKTTIDLFELTGKNNNDGLTNMRRVSVLAQESNMAADAGANAQNIYYLNIGVVGLTIITVYLLYHYTNKDKGDAGTKEAEVLTDIANVSQTFG